MKINLSKKKYVISAGADGLGFAIANKIISSGGKVYLSDINKSKIDKINSNKKYHNKIFAQHLDCTNPKDIKEYFNSLTNSTLYHQSPGLTFHNRITKRSTNEMSLREHFQTSATALAFASASSTWALPLSNT